MTKFYLQGFSPRWSRGRSFRWPRRVKINGWHAFWPPEQYRASGHSTHCRRGLSAVPGLGYGNGPRIEVCCSVFFMFVASLVEPMRKLQRLIHYRWEEICPWARSFRTLERWQKSRNIAKRTRKKTKEIRQQHRSRRKPLPGGKIDRQIAAKARNHSSFRWYKLRYKLV